MSSIEVHTGANYSMTHASSDSDLSSTYSSSSSSTESTGWVETRRPSTNTQRSSRNPASETSQPIEPPEPAPDYFSNEISNVDPPDITQDTAPPNYRFNAPPPPSPFFQAILDDDEARLNQLLARNPQLVNEKDPDGRTPLHRAIIAYNRRIGIVRRLLEAGAEVDAWSIELRAVKTKPYYRSRMEKYQRTALMSACASNHLSIVRILLAPPYNADPTLVAPDGQHALRLASHANAREIVNLLPSLRAGGWKRMKHRAHPHIIAIKATSVKLYKVGRFLVWKIPKCLVILSWQILQALGSCTARVIKQEWERVKRFPEGVMRFCIWAPGAVFAVIKRTPGILYEIATKFLEGLKTLGEMVWNLITVQLPKVTVALLKFLWKIAKWVWKLFTVSLPRLTVALVKWVWKIITVRLPKVLVMVFWAVTEALIKSCDWFVGMLREVASLLHTFVSFLLQRCTLSNLLEGARQTFHFFFFSVPEAIWDGLKGTYKLCYRVVKGLFGTIGWLLWHLGECLIAMAMWFPTMIGKIFVNLGKIMMGALKEVRLWVNPKANV